MEIFYFEICNTVSDKKMKYRIMASIDIIIGEVNDMQASLEVSIKGFYLHL